MTKDAIQKLNDWEKRFDEEFLITLPHKLSNGMVVDCLEILPPHNDEKMLNPLKKSNDIKYFISNLLASEKKRWKEEMRKEVEKVGCSECGDSWRCCSCPGVRKDVLKLLE